MFTHHSLLRWVLGLLTLLVCGCSGSGSKEASSGQPPIAPSAAGLPENLCLPPGGKAKLVADLVGVSSSAVVWRASSGSIDSDGLFSSGNSQGSITVIATSVSNLSLSASIEVDVAGELTTAAMTASGSSRMDLWPRAMTVPTGASAYLLAATEGLPLADLVWSIQEPGGGHFGSATPGSTFALMPYTAPAAEGTYHVTVASRTHPSLKATSTITVRAKGKVAVSVNPDSVSLQTSDTQAFRAMVAGAANKAVTWSVLEPHGGSVSSGGLYVAPAVPGTFHVRATSVADPTKSAQATVTVNAVPVVEVTVTPTTATLFTGATQPFTATVIGTSNSAVIWSVVEGSGGTVNTSGVYSAPANPGTFHVRATSVADPTKSAQATVTVNAAPVVEVTVTPTTATLFTGATQPFTATVTGTSNGAVTWSVVEGSGGTVNTSGVYSAPANPGTFHVRATSVADPTKSAQATVTVSAAPVVEVSVTPATATLFTGATQPFTATVTGTSNSAVTWSVVEPTGGSVSSEGLYTAPAAAGTYQARATSVQDPSKSALATVTVTAPTPAPIPSGYLLLTSARLTQIRADAAANVSTWVTLKQNVEANLTSTDGWDTGPENFALAYLVSGDARYANRAYWWAQQSLAMNLSRDSYYDFGELLKGVAMVLNYCAPTLTAAQAKGLADYLHASTDELWYHNQGSGWGLDNPRNNYHQTFLMGTAFAGYALKAAGDARGDQWIALLKEKLEQPGGVMTYLNQGVPGGDWDEGVNYAEGSKMHMALTFSVIAAAGGTNYFNASPFFQNMPRFALYAIQPGGRFLYPGGDLARESAMPVSPFERALIQPVVYGLADSEGRRLGQWFLKHVMPSYSDSDHTFTFRTGYYLDVLFSLELPETAPATQLLSYHTPVTQWVNWRSDWDDAATSISLSGSPRIFESHQHMDTGSFTIWKGGWQAGHTSTFSHSGLIMVSEGHNLLRVPHAVWFTDENVQVPGMRRYEDRGTFAYSQVDSTRLYRQVLTSENIQDLLNEHTREFVYLRPNTLVVFDRVDAKANGQGFTWNVHFPLAPTFSGGRYSSAHEGGGLSLVKLLGGTASVVSDADLEPGITSFRVEEAATGPISRFLNVLEVASGSAPATTAQLVTTPGAVQGAQVGATVVLFSDRPKGEAPILPFSYTVVGTGSLSHLLCNMDRGISVQASSGGGNTLVTIASGSQYLPDSQGVIQFSTVP